MGTLTTLGNASDVPAGKGKAFDAGEQRIAVFQVNGQYWALDDKCPHAGASLAEGYLDGNKVGCPWHYAEFDLATGKHISAPANCAVRSYPVVVEDGQLKVQL